MLSVGDVVKAIFRGPQYRAIDRNGNLRPVSRRQMIDLDKQLQQANRRCRIDPQAASSNTGIFKTVVDFLARAFS